MAFSYIQSKQVASGGTTSLAISLNAATGTNNLIVVNLKFGNAPGTISVTDDKGNTYVQNGYAAYSSPLYQYFAVQTAGGASTITVATSNSVAARHTAEEFSGNYPTNAGVVSQNAQNTGSGTSSSANFSPSASAGQLCSAQIIASSAITVTPTTGYTVLQNGFTQDTAYKIAVGSSDNPAFTQGDVTWGVLAGVYNPYAAPVVSSVSTALLMGV